MKSKHSDNSNLYDLAINQPQSFATIWAKTETVLNADFDNERFNHYKKAVKNQAIKLFNSGLYRPLSIHGWQCKLLNTALQLCKPKTAYIPLWKERQNEQQAKFSKIDKLALSFQTA